MEFVALQGSSLIISNLFNEEHAVQELSPYLSKPIDAIVLSNVGLKIMRYVFQIFSEHNIAAIQIKYDWNTIMVTPYLVCYDKNQWKSLQQLNNWNKEWLQLLDGMHSVRQVNLDLIVSWGEDQWIKSVLEGVARLPNVANVNVSVSSRSESVKQILLAYQQAKIFHKFNGNYVKYVKK